MQNRNKGQQKNNQVKPLIIEFNQQESLKKQSESLIKKMLKQNNSNIKYGGGYQNRSELTKEQKNNNKPLYREEGINYADKKGSDVYGELGVSKMQSKYRVIEDNYMDKQDNGYTMNKLQQKIQLLKQDRNHRNNQLLQKVDTYTISNNKDRYQNVTHAQSILDVINLQNIQAKLQAHRRNMRQVQEEYNAKKGKQMPIDRYGYMKVNIDVDKQYAQLEVDHDKVYQMVRKRENLQPGQAQFEELWEQKKRNDPKLAQYDAKFQQYLVTKDAKNLIGSVVRSNLYTWDKYKQPNHHNPSQKSKPKPSHLSNSSPQKAHKKQTPTQTQVSKYGPDGIASIRDISDVIATKDDKFIAAYIFAQIDKGKVGLISKEELHQYIMSQVHIVNGYNIDTKWLYTDIDNFQTSRKGMLSRLQLSTLLATLQKLQHPTLTLTNKSSLSSSNSQPLAPSLAPTGKATKNIHSTFNKHRSVFQKLFNTLDFNDDKLIKRQEFIQNIYVDSDCVNILDQEVINIAVIGKSIKFRQVIGFVLDDYLKEKNQKLKKSKEYITFNRFCEYFQIPESLDLSKIDRTSNKKKQQASTQSQIFDLPQQYMQLLKDIYSEIPRIYQQYIVCADFVQAALRDPQILALSDELCRLPSIETVLPAENLQTTLIRMQKECDQYGTWEDLRLYFSRRGRPLDWDYQLINQKKQIRGKKLKEQRESLSKSKLRETQKYFQYSDAIRNKSKQKSLKGPNKYTIPQPFDITDMKQKANQEMGEEGQHQFDELKKKFKAQPVNQQILQPKPELIQGKLKKETSEQKRPQYKYENYQNDRIERALKRAQEEYEKNQIIKTIIEKTQIKAKPIEIDLKKKYDDVIKQQEKKRKQKSKYKPTNPKASESLYPNNPAEQRIKKIQNVKQNLQKGEQISKRKKQQLQQQIKRAKQKNDQKQKLVDQVRKREQQQKQKRDKIATDGLPFKPTINKRQLTDKQKQAIQKARQQKQRARKQQEIKALRAIEERKKKILEYEKKSQFVSIQGLEDQEIINNLDFVDFQQLLIDEQDKAQYRKQFDNKNKTLRELKEREAGLAGRQRAAMQQQQKRIMEEKRKLKQKVQKQKTQADFSSSKVKGQKAVYETDLNFHKSKALRRYRAIMQGKKPDSQFDKYSIRAQTQKGQGNQQQDQQQTFSQNIDEDENEGQQEQP